MIDTAIEHLRAADPVLARVLDELGGEPPRVRDPQPEHYGALLRAIVGQQLSTKAARAIWERLLQRFEGRAPTPAEVLAEEPEVLRAAVGLSRAKVSYLRSLAEHVLDGSLELERLDELSDERVIEELVAVRGIGEWSAHMFLMFQLQRPDVLAPGDLGIRKAIGLLLELPELPPPMEVVRIAERWRPHRTTACRLLWAWLD
ncbi:MAG: DNA-3-methyladenine glycosylase [Solirubrobacteraceae bacterium]